MMAWTGIAWLLSTAQAGGGPNNVMILYNAAEVESEDLAYYYRGERFIPYDHLCPVDGVDATSRTISFADYDATIKLALDGCLNLLAQPDEIHTLVLVRGLPYRVDIDEGYSTSVQAMLQVSDAVSHADSTPLAGTPQTRVDGTWQASVSNPAWVGSGSDADFTITNPDSSHYRTAPAITAAAVQPSAFTRRDMDDGGTWDFSGGLFLVSRLDGFDYADAYDLVDRAIAAEGSTPTEPITCMAADESTLGARDPECAYTIDMLDAVGIPAQWIAAHDTSLSGEDMAAILTGSAYLQDAIDGNTYAPGAFAFNLAESGAAPEHFFCDESGTTCPETETQTAITRFVRGGLTGAHGMVAQTPSDSAPGAGALLLATMGYSLIESAFLTQRYLYWQNLYLGDPLAAPWAERPEVTLEASVPHPTNAPIVVSATHPNGIAQITLYVNGRRMATVSDEDTLVFDPTVDTKTILPHPPESIELLELLAVAIAKNAVIDRPGWPSAETLPQADVQGWARVGTTLTSPPTDDDEDDTADPADPTDASYDPAAIKTRCSCASAHPGLAPWFALLGLAIGSRRRNAGVYSDG